MAGPGLPVADLFRAWRGTEPEVIWHAPGRVNLIGEHTDYNDGLVLPFALASGVLAAGAAQPGAARPGAAAAAEPAGSLAVRSRQQPGDGALVPASRLRPGAVDGWAGYVAGAAWALREAGYPVPGAAIAIDSDLPMGAGLASSAALCCAAVSCLAALSARAGDPHPGTAEVVSLARSAEADFVGMPCGIMDQSASMLAEDGHALLLDCRSGESTPVPFDPAAAGLQLLVVDTGVRHELADGQYALRRSQCQQAAALLGVGSLRDITGIADLDGLAGEVLLRRARHVVSENQRVTGVAARLRDGGLAECGPLLTASHHSLRDDFEVSWPAADAVVSAATAAGALGARMTGGGFGGSVLVLLPAGRVAGVTAAVREALGGDPALRTVTPASGAHQVWPAG
jgi:galactokinase